MKIYTRTGDEGRTGLFGGGRVSKADARIEAYGAVDELNATLGAARAAMAGIEALADADAVLHEAQNRLFDLGAELATPDAAKRGLAVIGPDDAQHLEAMIDRHEALLPELKTFVLPGGTSAAALLHVARTVCRRAERQCVAFGEQHLVRPDVLIYLNRLSDLLFVLARAVNHAQGVSDTPWEKKS
ncbi:Cob(I)yrinic acid a,c-diamide adenosyltransferase [Pirellulimonas nuda]|uniref:Corrinoid adenosyltransferase n=1 Tax=Pirellulimonas nuda TaxID=2528009 RepID=A0A518D6B9_9BACT|nr:cob(I)yrinic acid a,c-diamide adenosyltransferase [Pirellulimonas nuda]QDU87015.1 Cob(I)yrinic acid a,c-diamide adenosyltransferase [Pirellulimonas nuda]